MRVLIGLLLSIFFAGHAHAAGVSLEIFGDEISAAESISGRVCFPGSSFEKSILSFQTNWEEEGQLYESKIFAKFVSSAGECGGFSVAPLKRAGVWTIELKSENGDVLRTALTVNVDPTRVMKILGSRGSLAALKFADEKVTTNSSVAEFCSNALIDVFDAKLWKIDGGHGSSLPIVTKTSNGCARITQIDFFLAGQWTLQVQLEDGEMFQFPILVNALP